MAERARCEGIILAKKAYEPMIRRCKRKVARGCGEFCEKCAVRADQIRHLKLWLKDGWDEDGAIEGQAKLPRGAPIVRPGPFMHDEPEPERLPPIVRKARRPEPAPKPAPPEPGPIDAARARLRALREKNR